MFKDQPLNDPMLEVRKTLDRLSHLSPDAWSMMFVSIGGENHIRLGPDHSADKLEDVLYLRIGFGIQLLQRRCGSG